MSTDKLNNVTVDRERSCDRCDRDIHNLEPAATVQFGAAIETDELVVCLDCANILIEWWNGRETEKADDSSQNKEETASNN